MKKLLILSGKGGTGKTTVAAAMIAFSRATAIADCDVDAPNLHLACKQAGTPTQKDFMGGKKALVSGPHCIGCGACAKQCRFEAIEIRCGKAEIDEISCEGCGVCQLVCPTQAIRLADDTAGTLSLYRNETVFSTAELKMGRGNAGKLVTEVKFALFGAAKDEPLAIIDGSPGIGCPVIASISGVDLVLVVAEPSVSGISDLRRLCRTACGMGAELAVCVNKYDVNTEKADEIEAFCRENGIRFVGRIPFDRAIPQMINAGGSIVDTDSRAGQALGEIHHRTMRLLEAL